MQAERIDDPATFLDRAGPLLLEDEARNNLILGVAGTLRDHPRAYAEHRLWVALDEGAVVGAALRTPPFNLILGCPATTAALPALAETIHSTDTELPGVTAALPEADAFAVEWEARTGSARRARMAQRIYRAEEIRPPAGMRGRHRIATEGDRTLLVAWLRAFAEEALHGLDAPAGNSERAVDTRLAGAGGFVLWEADGEIVSLAGWGGRTPNGVRIGPVYTPPEYRRSGYGTAVTAAVSQDLLASGRRFCFLYTDLSNPTSNSIYAAIGYEPVCDSVEYAFDFKGG
ncbi:MAG: GNAT family N-acetyltransferase [Gaiellaceae bacterium]